MIENLAPAADETLPVGCDVPPMDDLQDPGTGMDPVAVIDPTSLHSTDTDAPQPPVLDNTGADDADAGAVAPPIDLGNHDVAPPVAQDDAAGNQAPQPPVLDDAGAGNVGAGNTGADDNAGAVAPPIDLGDHDTAPPTGTDAGSHDEPLPPTVGANQDGGSVVPDLTGDDSSTDSSSTDSSSTDSSSIGLPPTTDGSLPDSTSTQVSSDDVDLIVNVIGGDVTINIGHTDLPSVVGTITEATGTTATPVSAPAVLDTTHPHMPESGHVVLLPTGADEVPSGSGSSSLPDLGSGPLLVHGVDAAAGTMAVTPLSTPAATPFSLPIAGVGEASQLSGNSAMQFDSGDNGTQSAIALGVGGLLLIPVARRVIRRLT